MTKQDAPKELRAEPDSSGYESFQSLGRTSGSNLYRIRRAREDGFVLLKRLDEKFEPARADRFRMEHELLASLHAPGIPRPLALISDGAQPTMLVENVPGDLLESMLVEPLSITRALRFGVQLASSLGGLHDQRIVHRDLRPVNLLASRGDDRIGLVDLSWATAVGCSGAPLHDDLAYIAPEQTGRTDHAVDGRADLYSLGVILYRMLSGRLPFAAADALEWMHCHLARAPVPIVQYVPELPGPVAAIVAKLLAKGPGERYQSARGVAADLERCLAEWEAGRHVADFALSSRDIADRIAIPDQLFGREAQVAELHAAWSRVQGGGATEVALVFGYSGIGKTSLVNELRKPVLDAGGFFLVGKFDQRKRDIPYASFRQAFQSLVQQLLGKSEAELGEWRRRLTEALGANAQLITAIIPELEHIIGPRPNVPEVGAHEARNRFHATFQKFLGVFATQAHPLLLFIDDLQWLDPASLTLLEYLGTQRDIRYLLFIGAYRDNEVTAAHALHLTVHAIRKAGTKVSQLPVGPMSCSTIADLISRALHTSVAEATPLAELVHEKTGGNPFFATQFLLSLHEENVIWLDASSGGFRWEMQGIRARSVTDNVVDLLLVKLRRLPQRTQLAIAEMACLGIRVETAVLAAAHGGTEGELHAALAEAVDVGLVFRADLSYRFLHDRVQEAGYALVPPNERVAMHLGIARRLSARLSETELADRVFDLVGQWNRAADQLSDAAEIAAVIRLNATAGAKAKSSAAYASARAYYAAAAALLPQDAWSVDYDTALALHLALAECECLVGAYAKSAELIEIILGNARTPVDCARAHLLRMRVGQLAGNYQESISGMLEGLRALGMTLPESEDEVLSAARDELTAVVRMIDRQRTPGFVAPQAPIDPRVRAMIDLLDEGDSATFVAHAGLWPLVVTRSVTLRLQHGETMRSPATYVSAGLAIADVTGDMTRALEVSELAMSPDYLASREPSADAGKLIAKHAAMINIWCRHFATTLPLLEKAFSACVEVGDFVFVGYMTFNVVWLVFESGASLETVAAAASRWAALARETHSDMMGEVVRGEERFVARLRGIYDIGSSFDFDEAIAKQTAARFNVGVNFLLAMRQMTAFLEGRYDRAWQHTEAMSAVVSAARLLALQASYHTFRGLTAAALYAGAGPERRDELLEVVQDEVRRHERWRQHGPDNFSARHALLSAELARIEGRLIDAELSYEEAIKAGREHRFLHYEALAWELAARFYRGRGLVTIADSYLREARSCYCTWGAAAKVKQLDRDHQQLQTDASSGAVAVSGSVRLEALDLLAVVRASQAISQQLVLDDLLKTLMAVVLESAGAETAALLIPRGAELTVAALASVDGPNVVVRQPGNVATAAELPLSVLNYVRRSKERVLLTDVSQADAFSADPSFQRRTPKSVLCLPIIFQSEIVGLLYLENGVVANAFPPDRVEMLTLLAGQAAISLQHARLYADLQRENLEREQAEAALRGNQDLLRGIVDNSRALIYVKDLEGRFLLVNRHLAEVLGTDREQLLGKTDFDIFPSEQANAYRTVDLRVLTAGIPVEAEEVGPEGEGSRTYLSVKAPLFDPNGNTYGMCGISTDITERKRTEQTLRQKEEELRQSQKMEAIGNLAGGVAHDFNNLLTVILGSSQLLSLEIGADHPSQADVRAIEDAAQRAAALTQQLLAFSRKQFLQPQVLDLNQVLPKIELILRRLIGEDIELIVKPGSLGRVLVDPGQVEQVLLNLAVNSRDAMPTGGRLTIETHDVVLDEADASRPNGVVPGPHVLLTVSDSGVGMDALTQSRMFEPFFTTKGLGKGTGLGLSTVFGIVQQSGGAIDVSSELGKGTTFKIYFPHTKHSSRRTAKPPPHDDKASLKGNETILLVEDETPVRALTRTLLREAGYHVLEAENAEAALALAAQHPTPIHLLLTDVVLPRVGGRLLADQLCAQRPETKVLFMSGYTNDSILRHGVVDSAVELLQKPFTRVALLRHIRALFDA